MNASGRFTARLIKEISAEGDNAPLWFWVSGEWIGYLWNGSFALSADGVVSGTDGNVLTDDDPFERQVIAAIMQAVV